MRQPRYGCADPLFSEALQPGGWLLLQAFLGLRHGIKVRWVKVLTLEEFQEQPDSQEENENESSERPLRPHHLDLPVVQLRQCFR